jgi:uncharacterized membrane protein AbrB (regulator of aidB expression)
MSATRPVLRSWLVVLVVTVAASAGFAAAGLPSPVLFGALLGCYAAIGVRSAALHPRQPAQHPPALPPSALLILLVIVACALLGLLLSAVTGVDRLAAYLATTPGGLFAVLAIAAGSGSDVTYVLAIQVIRVFAMLLFAPVLGRLLRGR